jgi:hypothetical protein
MDHELRIFMSSGGGDAPVVDMLSRCLKRCGFDVYHYRDDMPGGAVRIENEVHQAVSRANAAILCVSDTALSRGWVQTEINWCHFAQTSQSPRMRHIDYLQVGPLSFDELKKTCPVIEGRSIVNMTDLDHREVYLQNLLNDLGQLRWGRVPSQTVATVIAMTADEASGLLDSGQGLDRARELCEQVGVAWPGKAPLDVLARYGDSPLSFKPFGEGPTALELAREALEAVNGVRQSSWPPILLRWVEPSDARAVRRALQTAGCGPAPPLLAVIDSLSLILPTYQHLLDRLMAGVSRESQPVVWVPPFTHCTGHVEERAAALLRDHGTIQEWFEDWRKVRSMVDAFDFTTPGGLRRHFADILSRVAVRSQEADRELANEFEKSIQAPGVRPTQGWRERELRLP